MGKRTLLLGRAGSGKTYTLLYRVAGFLAEARERRALLLVPTISQASHLKRLLLTRTEGIQGFFDESVVTFTGLGERVLADRPIGDLLSGLRQDLLVREALTRVRTSSFRRLAGFPGFRRAALELLKELKQNGLAPPELAEELARVARDRGGAVGERLRGFLELLRIYEEIKEERGHEDHEDYLRRTRDVLSGTDTDPGIEFLGVDGFQNFTRLEREILLLLRAKEVVVTLPYDRELEPEEGRQFKVSHETYRFLVSEGFAVRTLTGNRRARPSGLVHVEARLFGDEPETVEPDGSVRVLEGADPDDEADRVARTVLELVRGQEGPPLRYRDIVLVVRDIRSRKEPFERAFRRHRVPLRVYGADDLAGHPYVKSSLNMLRVASGDVVRLRVLSLLRSDHLSGIALSEVDRLEHDLLTHGDPTTSEDWVKRVRGFSRPAGDLLTELLAPRWAEPRSPGELGREVLSMLDRRLIPLWMREAGDEEGVRLEARAVEAVRHAVSEQSAALSASGADVALPDFLPLLGEALRAARAGRGDRRLEVVNMIDAREARQWEAPVVIVSGLVEGEFPKSPREDIFLSDRDRERENREGRLALRERLLEREEERYLFYVAMTRARTLLVLTWPGTDGGGEATLRSLFLEEVLRIFPEGSIVSPHRLSDPLPLLEEVADREDLRRRALLGISEPYRPGTPEEDRALLAAAIHDLLCGAEGPPPEGEYSHAVRLGERFLLPPAARLRGRLGPPDGRRHSSSSLEDFVQCPFRHFAGRTLRLQGPPRAAAEGLDNLLLGEIAHEVMRVAFLNLLDGEPLPDAEWVERIFAEVFAEKAAGAPPGLMQERSRRVLLSTLHRFVERERSRLDACGTRPVRLEAPFEFSLTPEVRLSGKVDRIDQDVEGRATVIDYKYSKRGFDSRRRADAEDGAHLQLPIYMLALREAFDLDPVSAVLYPMKNPRLSGYALLGTPEPEEPVMLTLAEREELLARTRERVLSLDARICDGEVEVAPRDTKSCSWCDFADVCRVETYRIENRRGR